MTSSSFYELTVSQKSEVIARARRESGDSSANVEVLGELDPRQPALVRLARSANLPNGAEVWSGPTRLLELAAGSELTDGEVHLRDDWGEIAFSLREVADETRLDEPTSPSEMIELFVPVVSRPEVRRAAEAMIADLERIHTDLARDVAGRSTIRRSLGIPGARMLDTESELERLEALRTRLAIGLARIGRQPSRAIHREMRRERWRAGDRLDSRTVNQLASSGQLALDQPAPAPGAVLVSRRRLTFDITEHRYIKDAVRRLGRRARSIASHCERAEALIEGEAARWGRSIGARRVFDERYAPRQRRWAHLASEATSLERSYQALESQHDYLAEASAPRGPIRPTPLFLNRPGYRETYRALVEAFQASGVVVDGEELRIRIRNLWELYEYWCFIRVVEVFREWLGQPEPYATYQLVDDVYRPDLKSGQSFRFRWRSGFVRVTYEPEILPEAFRSESPLPIRAALSTAPLRPDILIEASTGDTGYMLVLDAKSTSLFDLRRLWEPTDYRSRIFEPATGRQPVRQVFFLHRSEDVPALESLPGYLDGERGDTENFIIGAVTCVPAETELLEKVLRRFLEISGGGLHV
jgi:hypothetical protein